MGMAASQARYLALTARKTNTEWEGQQINQARTALANQSANLFNRLLDLEVPDAPKTTDYTELQYSYSDGDNESVLDSWQQLSSADPNYNYIVNHYYYADIYTGSKKLLEDPQVQTKTEVTTKEFVNPSARLNADGSYDLILPDGTQINCSEITNEKTNNDEKLKNEFNEFAKAKNLAYQAGAIPSEEVYGYQDASGTWHFYLKQEIDDINNMEPKAELVNGKYEITTADGTQKFEYEPIDSVVKDTKFESALREYEESTGMIQKGGALKSDDVYAYHDQDGNWHFYTPDASGKIQDSVAETVTYVGNSKLTELTKFTDDQATELAQILKDCSDSSVSKYLSLDAKGNLVYDGKGIYTFDMNGKTYFTTEADLYNSMNNPYKTDKPIDIQSKLAYYNASYVKTKIQETNHALLETDSNGRFTSVRFDNDSIVYSLNVETVTDEAAYQDAMNQYLYKKEQYEKTIADINAKTSIIQQEDRTLELRLKQLDTEQNALATEMDAVKKVIKDNVEKTFKTFSD